MFFNTWQEVADIIWRAMAGEGKDAVRQAKSCRLKQDVASVRARVIRAAKEVVKSALRKGSRPLAKIWESLASEKFA